MATLRATLFLLFELITVIPWAFLCLLCAPLPRRIRYAVTMCWPTMQIWAARWLLGIRHEVIGVENLPDGPAILLSKHQSTWETMFYPGYMPREVCFVFKRELLYLPFFGWGIGLLDMIHINRGRAVDAFEEVVRQGTVKLAQGRWIIMFPEGTRMPVGAPSRFKSGGARLAARTSTPVVPIAVNSGRVWPKNSFIKHPGLVTVSIGPTIETAGRSAEAINTEVQRWIETEMRRMNPEDYAVEPQGGPTAADQDTPNG